MTVSIVFMLISNVQASYLSVPAGAESGSVEVYDTTEGLDYGMARIDYHWWFDEPSGYWHYAYQIFNNDYYNTPTDRTDDYHFGYIYDTDATPDKINKFDVVFDPASGIDDLLILDTMAGSTAGGGGWAHSIGYNIFTEVYTGLDWIVSGSTGTQIGPAVWDYDRIKGTWYWINDAAGDRSTQDGDINGGQYFEIASKWAPGWCSTAVTAGVSSQAGGMVIGPSVIPEPASCLILGIGAGCITLFRKK